MSLLHFLAMSPAPEGGGQGGAGAGLMGLLPFVLIFVIFYFLIIRPQQQRQKKHQAMLNAVKKGDRVLTSGGLFADVINVKDDKVVAEIAKGIKVEIAKQAISGVVGKAEE
jgi:preprotein translocase subunit YajC